MLNKSERYTILKIWKLYLCVVGQLPIQIDLSKWELQVPQIKQQWIYIVYYSLYVLHSILKTSSFIYTYLFIPDTQLYQLMVHAIVASASVMCAFWYYVAYIQDPALFDKYVEMTLVGNVGGMPDRMDGLKTHWRRRLREYSMQDLVALCSPSITVLTSVAICVTYVYDPSMRLLLYAALPTYLQNWATFGLLLLEEFRFLLMMTSIAGPIWQMQVTSFDLVNNRLLLLVKRIQRQLRCLQLYVGIFNKLNSNMIFSWKLMSISMCIMSGYAAIAHFSEYPVFGIAYYILLFDGAFIYAVMYDKAFRIPLRFRQATESALARTTRKDVFGKRILSIPPTGIKVGHFHTMERASTPIFLSFVLTNIVSMLVAYG